GVGGGLAEWGMVGRAHAYLESDVLGRHSRESGNPCCCCARSPWIPAFAGMTTSGGNGCILSGAAGDDFWPIRRRGALPIVGGPPHAEATDEEPDPGLRRRHACRHRLVRAAACPGQGFRLR